MSSEKEKMNRPRRSAMKYGIAAIVAAAVAGGGGYAAWQATRKPTPPPDLAPTPEPTPTPTKRKVIYSGASWVMYPEVAEAFTKQTGIECDWSIIPYTELVPKLLASKGRGFDVTSEARHVPFHVAPPPFQPIPIEKIPRLKGFVDPEFADEVDGLMRSPETEAAFPMDQVEKMKNDLWYEEGKSLWGVPINFNYESIGYNPEFVPYAELDASKSCSYGEIFKEDYKGRTALLNGPAEVYMGCLNWWLQSGQYEPEESVVNPTPEEIDMLEAFFMNYIKAGQFKTFYSEFGEAINLFSSKEAWIMWINQPGVMGTRRTGTPCYFAQKADGLMYWFDLDYWAAHSPNPEEAIEFMNFRIGPWWTNFIANVGYSVPTWPQKDVREAIGAENGGYFYMGQRTYKPIDECMAEVWPDKPEFADLPDRLTHGLFVPEKYNWQKEEDRPHSKGVMRDQGSLDDRNANTAFYMWWPDNQDYLLESYKKLQVAF